MAQRLSRVRSERGRGRWADIVRDLKSSGLSVSRYAQAHGLSAKSLYWWRWKLGAQSHDGGSAAPLESRRTTRVVLPPTQTFVPVRVLAGSAPARTDGALQVVLSSGRRIEIRSDFDGATLERVIRILEALPC